MAPGKKNLKATKKFEKNHLKGVLDKRKASAKIKQKLHIKDKKKTTRTKDSEFFKGGKEEGEDEAAKKPAAKGKKINDMSVDDFFQGGFDELIEKKGKAGKSGKGKRVDPEGDAEMDDGSDSDVLLGQQPADSDSEDDGEADDDAGMSKKTMEDLAEKDPEFYKFLIENDPEALDFDDDADLAEVDELSGGEDESEE